MSRGVVTAVAAVLTVVLGLSAAPPAQAWSNGVDGPNSYGTHDLILDRAIDMAGRDAAWVRTRVALRATDDPDTRDGIDHASGTWWHVYDEWGSTYGGAPEAAAVWFRRTQRRLERSRPRSASRALGILAHIVGDIANPMHTDHSAKEDPIHSPYEADVDERSEKTDRVYPTRYDGRDRARPYRRTVRLARASHVYYWDLVDAYSAHRYNRRVHRITRRQLNRGVNALADLITSL